VGTAKFVRQLDGWHGDARLYHVRPPIRFGRGQAQETDHVVVSCIDVVMPAGGGEPGRVYAVEADPNGLETFLFAADQRGVVLDWDELPGSFRGRLDAAEALRGAGYEIAR